MFHFLVEYQGEQHYHPIDYFGSELALCTRQKHDAIKAQYAVDNNYQLIVVPYTEIENITAIFQKLKQRE